MKFKSKNHSFIVITLKWLRFSFQLSDEHIIAFNSLWGHHLIQERRSNVMHQLFQLPIMHLNWFVIWFWELYVEPDWPAVVQFWTKLRFHLEII